jgi:LysM repeat protein
MAWPLGTIQTRLTTRESFIAPATPALPKMTGSIRQVSPAGPTVNFQIDPESAELTGGVGGWTEIPRARMGNGTEWSSSPLLNLSLDLWFSEIDSGKTIEPTLAQFRAWGGQLVVGAEPPVLQVVYAGYSDLRWVINDVAVDATTVVRNGAGALQQAKITLTLLEYQGLTAARTAADSWREVFYGLGAPTATAPVAGTTVTATKTTVAATTVKTAAPATPRVYVVKSGDSLYAIAGSQLKNASRWPEIASLNGLRAPYTIFPGQKLKVPAA